MVTELKLERVKRGMKQWRVASIAEISQTELSHYEVGRRRCPANLRYKLAKILETSVDELFPQKEEATK